MGKGSRTRKDLRAIRQKTESENKNIKQKSKIKKIVAIAVCCIIVVAIAISTTVYSMFTYRENSGYYLRNSVCFKSDNYELNALQYAYYFNQVYSSFVNDNSDSLEEIGLDTTVPLKEQLTNYDKDATTWYDYFLKKTKETVTNLICYAEKANAERIELNAEEKESIEASIENIEYAAKEDGLSVDEYLSQKYCKGINLEDIRVCLELTEIADKYNKAFDESLQYSDDDLENQYKNNPNKYSVVDYISYSFLGDSKDLKSLKRKAEELAKCTSEAEFRDELKAIYKENNGSEKSDKELEQLVNSCVSTEVKYNENAENKDLISWAFDSDTKAFDTLLDESADKDSYTVYMLLKKPYRLEYKTKNVRHILLSTKTYNNDPAQTLTAAQEMLEDIRKSDDVEKEFIRCAQKYSEDPGSASNGGLYENIVKGEMVTNFNDWCFYNERKIGDISVVSTDYGYHLMYFAGNGVKAWQVDAINDCKLNDFAKLVEDITNQYNVTFDKASAYKYDK